MYIRVACHIHSDWSYDGQLSLDKLGCCFSRLGYQAIMLSEHDRGFNESRRLAYLDACAKFSTKEMLLIPGLEYSDSSNTHHILVWSNIPFIGEGIETLRTLAIARDFDAISVFAHPSRRQAYAGFDRFWLKDLTGLEFWNRKVDGWQPSSNAQALLYNSNLQPFVGIDFHSKRQLFPLSMVIDINGDLTESAILDAIRQKKCYPMLFHLPLSLSATGLFYSFLRPLDIIRRGFMLLFRKTCSFIHRT